MKTTRLALAVLLLAGSSLLLTTPTFANPPDGHSWGAPGGHRSFHFTHRDSGHFSPLEHTTWIGGSWSHSWHNGRYGWWWFAGGIWYFYDAPIYPYPGYVSDYYVDQYAYGPGPNWYYCSNPPGYYPYVRACGVPWQPVPATAPPPPGPGYGPPPGPNSNGPPNDQPPPGYQGPDNGPGPGDQPPPGYQGPDNGAGPGYPPPPPSNSSGPN